MAVARAGVDSAWGQDRPTLATAIYQGTVCRVFRLDEILTAIHRVSKRIALIACPIMDGDQKFYVIFSAASPFPGKHAAGFLFLRCNVD